MMFYAQIPSVLGPVLLSTNGTHLTGLYFIDQKDCPAIAGVSTVRPGSFDPTAGTLSGVPIKKLKAYKYSGESGDLFSGQAGAISANKPNTGLMDAGPQLMQEQTPVNALALFRQIQTELHEYFGGQRRVFNTPLAPAGTSFQQQVWQALLTVPYGEVVSYADIARTAGLSAGHGRAVGTAVGRNPITILVPCHRVLSSSGTLTGYSGGLERKYALLELEGFLLR